MPRNAALDRAQKRGARKCRANLIGGTALLLVLGACKVGPEYARPSSATPESFRDAGAVGEAASVADRPWWEVFDDPKLTALIDQALSSNLDLRIATLRLEQVRFVREQVRSPLYPQVGYGGGVSRGRNEFLGGLSPDGGNTESKAMVDLNVFWEIDLWGRVQRADEAALAEILAVEEARRGITLSLVSEVAAAYFQLVGFDDQIAIARRSAKSSAESEQLFHDRAEGGISSDLPVLRAKALRATASASIPDFERRIAQLENAICLLLGEAPHAIERSTAPRVRPPEVPVGIPSELLERRPDIRAVEAELRAASARIGVAEADFFPRLGLTAALGKVTPELDAFTSGATNAWSVAAGLSGPIFQGGRLTAQLNQAKAAFEESATRYERSVLISLGEVADTLVDRSTLIEIEDWFGLEVTALSSAVELSRERYDAGRASYFEILDSQQQLFPAEAALSTSRTEQFLAYVRLYRALGGGWNLGDEWHSTAERRGPAATLESSPPAVGG